MSAVNFSIQKELGGETAKLGRVGTLETPHGVIHTPAFVAVGTKATVKALTPEQLIDTGAEVALANTYHLYLEPGAQRVKSFGGLHKFMNWSGPLMTDSGGFQVFFSRRGIWQRTFQNHQDHRSVADDSGKITRLGDAAPCHHRRRWSFFPFAS